MSLIKLWWECKNRGKILNDNTQTEKFYSGPYYGVKGVSCLIEEEVVIRN